MYSNPTSAHVSQTSIPRTDIIEKNIKAVNPSNFVLNSSFVGFGVEKKNEIGSESLGGTMTNYTKNREGAESIQNQSITKAINGEVRKVKRIKFLPKVSKETQSPRPN